MPIFLRTKVNFVISKAFDTPVTESARSGRRTSRRAGAAWPALPNGARRKTLNMKKATAERNAEKRMRRRGKLRGFYSRRRGLQGFRFFCLYLAKQPPNAHTRNDQSQGNSRKNEERRCPEPLVQIRPPNDENDGRNGDQPTQISGNPNDPHPRVGFGDCTLPMGHRTRRLHV